jgi:hypothetical protein
MSRHGYVEDLGSEDPLAYGQWRGRVASAICKKPLPIPHDPTLRGKGGQPLTTKQRERQFKKFGIEVGPKPRPRPKREKPKRESKPKQTGRGMSLLDCAVLVLQQQKTIQHMHPSELVSSAVAKRLWTPLAGATPASTLWSRILAEIKKGPKVSRFRLVSPGRFGLTAAGRKWVAE